MKCLAAGKLFSSHRITILKMIQGIRKAPVTLKPVLVTSITQAHMAILGMKKIRIRDLLSRQAIRPVIKAM